MSILQVIKKNYIIIILENVSTIKYKFNLVCMSKIEHL